MRAIDTIIIHCTDTKLSNPTTTNDLYRWHVEEKGWSHIGYHFYIDQKGKVYACRPIEMIGAHAKGYNASSIGICLEGGVSETTGKHADTRTLAQRGSLITLIEKLAQQYSIQTNNIIGHNEISSKACPCFDVSHIREHLHTANPLLFPL